MATIDFLSLFKEAKRQAKQQQMSHREGGNNNNNNNNGSNDSVRLAVTQEIPLPPAGGIWHDTRWDPRHDACLDFREQLLISASQHRPVPITIHHDARTPPTSSIHYFPPPSVRSLDLQPLVVWLESLPHGDSGQGEWKTMTYGKRRVCMFEDGEGEGSVGNRCWPPPLSLLARQLVETGIFSKDAPPNHVLLNEYQPGQGILPHTDGPAYESKTATLSLKSQVLLEFTPRLASCDIGRNTTSTTTRISSDPLFMFSYLLDAGSWITFSDEAYLDYCHGIAFRDHDETEDTCVNAPPGVVIHRQSRYSLTFRHKKSQHSLKTTYGILTS
jgi:hypothetical protein